MTELDRLKDLLAADAVKLGVHIRRMNSPGSPVYRMGENVWAPVAILVTSFTATAAVHYYLGFAILILGAWWWLTRVQPRVKDGVFDRTAAYVLASEAALDAYWSRGVLSLYAKLADGTEIAAARRDSWRDFVGRVEAARATTREA